MGCALRRLSFSVIPGLVPGTQGSVRAGVSVGPRDKPGEDGLGGYRDQSSRRAPKPPPNHYIAPMSSQSLTDDVVSPFQIENQPVRGRVVRMGAVVDDILTRHDYPPAVANLLGEACALA